MISTLTKSTQSHPSIYFRASTTTPEDGIALDFIGEVTTTPEKVGVKTTFITHTKHFSPSVVIPLRGRTPVHNRPIYFDKADRTVGLQEVTSQTLEQINTLIGTLADDNTTVNITERGLATLQTLASKAVPLAHAKIRKGATKFSTLLQWVGKALNALSEDGEFRVCNESYKALLGELTPRIYYLYRTIKNGYYTVEQYSRLIDEIYRLHKRTNTTSCMTKGEFSGSNSDFYATCLHPFHSYNTPDWCLLLLSDVAPEQLSTWDSEKSPFLARGWGWSTVYSTAGDVDYVTAGRYYGDDIACEVMDDVIKNGGANYRAKVRLYGSYGGFSMPYIDGYTQLVGSANHHATQTTEDGWSYLVAYVCDDGDYDHCWEVEHSTGRAGERTYYLYCEISEEYYDNDEMHYIEGLEGYVHERFYNPSSSDGLDGLEILRYLRD